MGRIEELAARYCGHIGAPWQRNLAGDQKTIFVVYPKTDERKLRARLELFDDATTSTGHRWQSLDLTDTFALWMASLDYPETFFNRPRRLEMLLDRDFVLFAAQRLREALTDDGVSDDTVIAVYGAGTLFGFTHLSEVLALVRNDIGGRLLVFFPGEYDGQIYHLLDARDGLSYLGVPITLHNGINDQ
jgi:hypothetical protein